MTLAEFESKGLLKKAQVDKEHILELLLDAEADLQDARREVSPEWCFTVACSCVLTLCHALLHSSGYKAGTDLKLRSLQALPAILGVERKKDIKYLLECLRVRKHTLAEETTISAQQVASLVRFAEDFYLEVIDSLRGTNPLLVADKDVSFLEKTGDGLIL